LRIEPTGFPFHLARDGARHLKQAASWPWCAWPVNRDARRRAGQRPWRIAGTAPTELPCQQRTGALCAIAPWAETGSPV